MIPVNSCSICHRSFGDVCALSDHQRAKSHRGYDYRCPVCAVFFTALVDVDIHQAQTNHYTSFGCEVCPKTFTTARGRDAHIAMVHGAWACPVAGCGKRCKTGDGLRSHQVTKTHWTCPWPWCGKRLKSEAGVKQHQEVMGHILYDDDDSESDDDEDSFPCFLSDCGYRFANDFARLRHVKEAHNYCNRCMKPFATTDLLEKHLYNSTPHVSEIRCLECSCTFPTVASLEKHGKSCKPRAITIQKKENEHYCSPCEKTFFDAGALEKHRNSLIHKPLSTNLTCLGGCGKFFSAPSSMVMHLESGACTGNVGSKLDKKVLDKSVFETDVDGVICHGAVPATIAATPSSEMSMPDSGFSTPGGVPVILTPSSSTMARTSSGMFTPLSPGVTDGSMQLIFPTNPLCCPLCPNSRPPFINERALEQHLASPTHAPKIYHCPEMLFPEVSKGPRVEFVSLSGLVQHLEAGACAGGGKKGKSIFTKAVRFVEDKLREMGILGDMKLIG